MVSTALLIFSLLGFDSDSKDDEIEPGQPVPFPVLLVSFERGDEEHRGYLLKGDPERGHLVVAAPSGQLLDHPLDELSNLRSLARKDVAEVPSAALVTALECEDEVIADEAAMLLGFQGKNAAQAITVALDGTSRARRHALRLLAHLPDPRNGPRIRACIDDEDASVRRHALQALIALDPEAGWDACEWALRKDPENTVRREAIDLLSHSNHPECVEPLIEAIERIDDRGLRAATFAGLRRLTGLRLGRDEQRWLAWWANHGETWVAEKTAELAEAEESSDS